MKQTATKNTEYLATRAKDAAKCYKECIGAAPIWEMALLVVTELVLLVSDINAFGELFGMSMGDDVGRQLALGVALIIPVAFFFIFKLVARRLADEKLCDRLVNILTATTVLFCLATVVLRFVLLAHSVDDESASPWAADAVVYTLPMVGSIIGSMAASLVLNNPVVQAKLRIAKLRMDIANREAELRSHECNDPHDLRQRVLRVFLQAESQADAMYRESMAASLPAISAAHGFDALDRVWGSLQPSLAPESGDATDSPDKKTLFDALELFAFETPADAGVRAEAGGNEEKSAA